MTTTEPEPEGGKSASRETETQVTTEAGTNVSHAEQTEVEWPPEAEQPAEEPAESLEDDGTPGTGTLFDPATGQEVKEEEEGGTST